MLSDLWLMSAATFRRLGKIEQAKGAIQEAEVRDEGNPNVWVQVRVCPPGFTLFINLYIYLQLGLYFLALGHRQHAIDALHKALMIDTDNVAGTVHLSGTYLAMGTTMTKEEGVPKSSVNAQETKSDIPQVTVTTDRQQQRRRSFTQPPPQFVTSNPNPSSSSVPSTSDDTNVDLAAGLLSHLTKGKGWDVPEAWYYLAKAYKMQGRKEKEREALVRALELQEGRGVRDLGSALGWCM
jgi:tetratricopeptide (TPR) repeat protein